MFRHPRRPRRRAGQFPAGQTHAELLERRALLSTGGTVPLPAGPGTDATVAGRYIFFNHSAYDGNDPAANASDDSAVSPAVVPLLPKHVPTLSNVSDYSRGINGVMVDVDHLASDVLTGDDFVFQTGNDGWDPAGWADAPAPASISVRRGAGVNGSDRVTLVWPDGAVRNTWLRVTVLDNSDTGLSSPDVFAFASLPGSTAAPAIGEAGNVVPESGISVTWRDLILTRRGLGRRRRVDLSSNLDHNRDRRVDARDLLAVRQNLASRLEPVQSPALPPVYYVSPTGDDAADGLDPLSAWRTVAKVNSTALPPGAHVLFQRGGEWHEQLLVSSSGTARNRVVFGSYGSGLKPKFWGSDPLDAADFVPVEGADSTYRILPAAGAIVNSIQADHAFFRSGYLAANRTADRSVILNLVKSMPGTWYQDPTSGELYVHSLGGDDPRTGSVLYTASVRENVVYVLGQHDVLIRNLVVDESARNLGGYAFGVGQSTNVTIENSEAYRAGKHHFGVINSTGFVGRGLYSAWAMPDQGYGGASAYVSYSDTVAPNSRSEWFDCAYDELDAAAAPYMVFYTHGPGMADLLVQDVHSNGGIGFVVTTDNPAERVRILGGVINNGGLTLYGDNVLVDGLTMRGPAARILMTGSNNTVQNVLIDGARPGAGEAGAVAILGHDDTFRFSTVRVDADAAWPAVGVVVKTQFGAGPRVYGNIIEAPRPVRVDPAAASTFVFDHNLFAAENPLFVMPDYTVRTLNEWRAQTGHDLLSTAGDPAFVNPAAGDLSLGENSAALDAFVPTDLLEGIPADAVGTLRPQGAAYDLGALERPA